MKGESKVDSTVYLVDAIPSYAQTEREREGKWRREREKEREKER